jgi:Tol biopolymer transport system component
MKNLLFIFGFSLITWSAHADEIAGDPHQTTSLIRELPVGVPLILEVGNQDYTARPNIRVFNISANTESVWDLPPETSKENLRSTSWASQSRQLMLAYLDAIYLVGADAKYLTVNLDVLANSGYPYDSMTNIAVSPNGQNFAYSLYGRNRQTDRLFTDLVVQQGKGTPWIFSGGHPSFQLDWSPDGKKIAYVTTESILIIKNLNGAIALSILGPKDKHRTDAENRNILMETGFDQGGRADIEAIRWSPDGTKLAFLAQFRLYIVTLDRNAEGVPFFKENDKTLVSSFAWSPDGKQLAFRSNFGSKKTCHFDLGYLFDLGRLPCEQPYYLYTAAADGSNMKLITKSKTGNQETLFWIH